MKSTRLKQRIGSIHRSLMYPLLAFFIPLLIRLIPEILMGSYLTGFDTMAHYVPTVLEWQRGDISLGSFIGTAPVLYSILLLLVSSGTSLFITIKITAVVLHGFLGLAIFGYAQKGLGWGSLKSLATALLATLFFVALRNSWDLLRMDLALVFFLVALMMFKFNDSFTSKPKHYLLLAIAMGLTMLSEQLIAAILFGILGITFFYTLVKKEHQETLRIFITSLPAVILFFAVFFLSSTVPEYRLIFGFSQNDGWLALFGFTTYEALFASAGLFLLFCFFPLIPFVVLGFSRLRNLQLYSWVVICTVLSFLPIVSPSNLRWTTLLMYPFAFFTVAGVERIRKAGCRATPKLFAIAVIFLTLMTVFFSFEFMTSTPEQPFSYFSSQVDPFYYQIPTSMLQNTVSLTDSQDVANAMQWVSARISDDDCLMAHRAFYGWASYYLNYSQIVLYKYENPMDEVSTVTSHFNGSIYLVWWVNGSGWYGQPSVSSQFHQVYQSGKIAVYQFSPP